MNILIRSFFLGTTLFLLSLPFKTQAQQKPASQGTAELQIASGDINILLDTYEKISGKVVIREANIPAVANIRIIAPGSIPKDQALRLLESVLLLNGCALIQVGDNSVKAVNTASTTAGKNPRNEGIPVYANPAELPQGDEIVTYFMQLDNISAEEALPIFQSLVPPHPWGVFVPVPGAQALVITENAYTIRQMIKVKDMVDVPSAKIVSRFVTLQRADAEQVADTLNDLIDSWKNKSKPTTTTSATSNQNNNQNRGGNNPQGNQGTAANTSAVNAVISASLNERNLVSGEVQLVADARTNRILVVTRPVNFDFIKNLIEDFDYTATDSSPMERPLKYTTASELLPILETMLKEDKDTAAVSSTTAASAQGATQSNATTSSTTSTGANTSTDTQRSIQDRQNVAPQAIMVGKTRIIADNQSNSIIVMGPPESMVKVAAILDKMDKKPMQVYLSTVIGQLSLKDDSELSIDLLQKFSKAGDFGVAGASVNSGATSLLNPTTLTSASAFTTLAAGLTVYGTIGSALDYYVHALQSTNRFKLISRPVIYTSNNKGALIASGQKIAVPSSTLTALDNGAVDSGSVVSNITYQDVELKLEVLPQINSEREVTLIIRQTNDSIVGSTVVSGNTIPTIGTQSVDTTITVPNKATIVLGGLITEDREVDDTGIPVLKDIPVLGYLFKGVSKTKNRSELVILIQPTVVASNAELINSSQEEVNRNKIGPEAKALGDNIPFDQNPKKAPVKPIQTQKPSSIAPR